MIVYRLSKARYKSDLSGKGAELAGGRWNSRGTALLYTAENRALCTAEIAVHTPLGIVPQDYHLVSIFIPDKVAVKQLKASKLPKNWNTFPHIPATMQIGDEFVQQNKYLVLRVPSAVIQEEYNYLINPLHADFSKVKIRKTGPFKFDRRLFDKA